ncbi:MAG: toprim domain-containing protein, partial [Lachnospiraceae bacterium]|nr:toprim domain-containing protein [Lachnospiraceae bacterium]
MDVISLHLAGFENSVAALGTAFNSQHATELRKYSRNIIVSFDSDGAGKKAALRAIPVFRAADMSIKILNMDPCKDPDEFLKKLGPEEYTERIRQAKNSCFFQIEQLQDNFDLNDTEQRVAYKYQVGELLLEFEDPVKRDAYVEDVTREFGFKEGELDSIIRKISVSEEYKRKKNNERELERREKERAALAMTGEAPSPEGAKKGPKDQKPVYQSPEHVKENALIGWLAVEPKLVEAVKPYITPEDFSDEVHRIAVKELFDRSGEGQINPSLVASHYYDRGEEFADELLNILTLSQVNEHLESTEQRENALSEMIRSVLTKSLERKMNEMSLKEFAQKTKETKALRIKLKE